MSDADGHFGERVAANYDQSSAEEFEPHVINATVDVLAGLAGAGRALEFAIGTGRIALPLSRRGVKVHGIDMSRAMVARLRAKPGGAGGLFRQRRGPSGTSADASSSRSGCPAAASTPRFPSATSGRPN